MNSKDIIKSVLEENGVYKIDDNLALEMKLMNDSEFSRDLLFESYAMDNALDSVIEKLKRMKGGYY